MATLTLTASKMNTAVRTRHSQPSPRREPGLRKFVPSPDKLQEVEDQLLAAAMEEHPGRERAITHLLSDTERPAAMTRRSLPLGEVAHLERMEDLLLEAIVRTHPNRASALDRLLGDVVGDAADLDETDELLERELFDMSIDRDCDGMS